MWGRIVDWKDQRGFGFIEPDEGGDRVFFHISAMVRGAPRPSSGDRVSFERVRSTDGKFRATNVRLAGFPSGKTPMVAKRVWLSVMGILVLPALWMLGVLGKVPMQIAWIYVAMSAVTFTMYGLDKSAAARNAQRTPEKLLQLYALIGGWPGALLAQQIFRHKSSKRSFQTVFWLMVALNCGVLGLMLSDAGVGLLHFMSTFS